VICASITFSFFQKWLDVFWCIWVFDSHLSTYGNLFSAVADSRLRCYLIMNVCRFQMAPSWVAVGQLASLQGVEYGVLVGFFLSSVPLLASVSTISFLVIHECARTLWMCMVWGSSVCGVLLLL
jgi:hypothetical protein